MKKVGYALLFFFIVLIASLTKCIITHSKGGFQIEGDKVMFYSYNHNTWAREGKEIKEADFASFKVLETDKNERNHFGQDKNNFYYRGKPIKELDSESTEYLGNSYYKDNNNVFYRSFHIKNAHAPTFELITDKKYAKDKNTVYLSGRNLEGSNASTFQILEGSYSTDGKNMYHGNKRVKNANPTDFKILPQREHRTSFWTDGKNVFRYEKMLEKADLNSWEIIDLSYSKDNKHVFYKEKLIEGADIETFKCFTPINGGRKRYHAEDKNHRYYNGNRVLE